MSFAALAWASKVKTERAADKLILLAYADRHSEETGCAYPSVAWLEEFSSLNRKTVIATVARLEAAGLLSDSGKRMGTTGQIKVYQLHIETVPKTEQSQKRNSSEKSPKQSQKRDTDTVRTRASEANASKAKPAKFVLPDHIPEEEWQGFVEMRVNIGKRMTDRAKQLAVARLDKLAADGWPPGEVLNHCTLNSYQGIFPPKDDRNVRQQRQAGEPIVGRTIAARNAVHDRIAAARLARYG